MHIRPCRVLLNAIALYRFVQHTSGFNAGSCPILPARSAAYEQTPSKPSTAIPGRRRVRATPSALLLSGLHVVVSGVILIYTPIDPASGQ
jgi:hypothetical protein